MRMLGMTAFVLALTFSSARAEEEAGSIGVQIKAEDGKIVVLEPLKDGPADKAGIKAGDVLVKIGDYEVKQKDAESEDLAATVKEVMKLKPGAKVPVLVKRGDKEVKIEVLVGKRSVVIPPKDKE